MPRFARNDIISLVAEHATLSLAESYTPSLHLRDLLENGDDLELGYSSPLGSLVLREAIARGFGARADDIVVTVGGAHALFLCALTLCAHGDHVVTTVPVFPPTRAGLDAVGAQVSAVRVRFDDGYRFDVTEFRRCLVPQTKLVSVASPQNPSGIFIPHDTLRRMLDVMGEVAPRARLLVDEAFREAAYGSDPFVPSAFGLDDRVICVGSLSKGHGAPGLRIGWILTSDHRLRDELSVAKFNTAISCSPIDEALAVKVLKDRERFPNERRAHLQTCLEMTQAWVHDNARYVEWVRPQAGPICVIRLKARAFTDEAARRFYEACASSGARVANGEWFGDEPRAFRIGFALLPPTELQKALDLLSAALVSRDLTTRYSR